MRKVLGALVVILAVAFSGAPLALAGGDGADGKKWHRHHRRHHHHHHHKHPKPAST